MLEWFYKIITHLMIISSIAGMSYFIVLLVLSVKSPVDRITRIIAGSAGILLFLGGKSIGYTLPEMVVGANQSISEFLGFLSYIAPLPVGFFTTHYLLRYLSTDRKGEEKFIYLLIIISTIVILIFSDIYIGKIVDNKGDSSIVTNLLFLLGVIFDVIFFDRDSIGTLYSEVTKKEIPNESKSSSNDWRNRY